MQHMKQYKCRLLFVCLLSLANSSFSMQGMKWKAWRACDEAMRVCIWSVKNTKEKILWYLNIPTPYQLIEAAGTGNTQEIERLVSLGLAVDCKEPHV